MAAKTADLMAFLSVARRAAPRAVRTDALWAASTAAKTAEHLAAWKAWKSVAWMAGDLAVLKAASWVD